jgi:muramoyltetrapeptide carboxypeptidase
MNKRFIKPFHLKTGDCVGIVSPSSTIKHFPRRFKRGIKALKKLGLEIKIGRYTLDSWGHNASTPERRAEDIMDFFKDKSIKAIFCTTGGWNANAVLPLLDYTIISKNPKIFCGFSDITVLNLAINKMSELITFNGPMILPSFGELRLNDFFIKWFKKIFFSNKPIGVLEFPRFFTDEILWWDKEDNRKRKMKRATKPICVYEGESSGILIGGNLSTLCALAGTKFFPDFSNAILFLEDTGESTASTERNLVHLEQLNVFQNINGLIYGRPFHLKIDSPERTLYDILRYFGTRYKLPIIMDVDIGHTFPIIPLPIGVKTYINSKKLIIRILESATR